jgi:hypothetical protein
MKVLGVGFGRTGTLSLQSALNDLGAGPCFHMLDLIQGENKERDLPYWIEIANHGDYDWNEVFEPWESTVDWPACSRWEELIEAFPEAKVLLNIREFEGFYESCKNTILAVKLAAQRGEIAEDTNREMPAPELWGVIEKLIWQGDFQGRFDDKEWVRQMYYDRIETIKNTVPAERLTVWEIGDGWGPLCEMLGVQEPDRPFPHVHSTNEFRSEFGLQPV